MQEKDLNELIRLFAVDKRQFELALKALSTNDLDDALEKILYEYVNDLNSSTLREMVTCATAGFSHNSEKLGYDGYKQLPDGTIKSCEVKPKNFIRNSRAKNPERLNGQGNYSDFTWRKFEKCKIDNPTMLLSGFVDGELIYVVSFEFSNKGFQNKLLKSLNKILPNGDEVNRYVRSAMFNFKDYSEGSHEFLFVHDNIEEYKDCISKDFLKFLLEQKISQNS